MVTFQSDLGLLCNYKLKKVLVSSTLQNLFLNSIDDTMIFYLNSKLDLNLSYAMDFRNLNSLVTWCIN